MHLAILGAFEHLKIFRMALKNSYLVNFPFSINCGNFLSHQVGLLLMSVADTDTNTWMFQH